MGLINHHHHRLCWRRSLAWTLIFDRSQLSGQTWCHPTVNNFQFNFATSCSLASRTLCENIDLIVSVVDGTNISKMYLDTLPIELVEQACFVCVCVCARLCCLCKPHHLPFETIELVWWVGQKIYLLSIEVCWCVRQSLRASWFAVGDCFSLRVRIFNVDRFSETQTSIRYRCLQTGSSTVCIRVSVDTDRKMLIVFLAKLRPSHHSHLWIIFHFSRKAVLITINILFSLQFMICSVKSHTMALLVQDFTSTSFARARHSWNQWTPKLVRWLSHIDVKYPKVIDSLFWDS